MSIKIESGRAVPKTAGMGRRDSVALPFAKMQVGDSFHVSGWEMYRIQYHMRKAKAAGLGDFTAAQEIRDEVHGVTVWRLS